MDRELLRKLPKVDELLKDVRIQKAGENLPHSQAVDVIRALLEELRQKILCGEGENWKEKITYDWIAEEAAVRILLSARKSLRRVINGTGVVLHTNLGRACLSPAAVKAVVDVAGSYSTLEYDPAAGTRGSRHSHVEGLICKITGAEAAMVVNNNAAATMLCLAALGRGKEIILSRGELVEIGGSFRIPEIMEESGAVLRETGTTNKTRLRDYERAISEETGALLKVHTSNYKIIGFTEETALKDLVKLGQKYSLPVIYDLGSGLMMDLCQDISEPTVQQGLADGADVVLFSGDKLLGGPQGGVIAGKKAYITRMKQHPLARVLRVDKLTLAAMEATFRTYHDREQAKKDLPVLSMLTREMGSLRRDALELKERIEKLECGFDAKVLNCEDKVGGGSAPGSTLPGFAVGIRHRELSTQHLERALREGELPVITRAAHDRVLINVRTITREEQVMVADKLRNIVEGQR